jgi:hypothetical protein
MSNAAAWRGRGTGAAYRKIAKRLKVANMLRGRGIIMHGVGTVGQEPGPPDYQWRDSRIGRDQKRQKTLPRTACGFEHALYNATPGSHAPPYPVEQHLHIEVVTNTGADLQAELSGGGGGEDYYSFEDGGAADNEQHYHIADPGPVGGASVTPSNAQVCRHNELPATVPLPPLHATAGERVVVL